MDTLTLKSIQLKGKHGVYDQERERGNDFELDVIFYGSFKAAGKQDDLSLAVNYEIAGRVAAGVMAGPSLLLIESLCFRIGEALFSRFDGVESMEIALRKMNPATEPPTAYSEIRMKWPG